MTREEPNARPDTESAIKQFDAIVAQQSYMSKRWRLKPIDAGRVSSLTLGLASYADEILCHGKQVGSE